MTFIRATTLEAYRRMEDEGRLSKARWKVWKFLYHQPGCTRNEIDAGLANGRPNPAFSRRLSELERMGVVERGPIRKCTITQFNADTWFALEQLPNAPANPLPKREQKLKRLGQFLLNELSTPATHTDLAAFVERLEFKIRELGLT